MWMNSIPFHHIVHRVIWFQMNSRITYANRWINLLSGLPEISRRSIPLCVLFLAFNAAHLYGSEKTLSYAFNNSCQVVDSIPDINGYYECIEATGFDKVGKHVLPVSCQKSDENIDYTVYIEQNSVKVRVVVGMEMKANGSWSRTIYEGTLIGRKVELTFIESTNSAGDPTPKFDFSVNEINIDLNGEIIWILNAVLPKSETKSKDEQHSESTIRYRRINN